MGSYAVHMDNATKALEANIKAAMTAAGMSVAALAQATGTPRTTLARKLGRPGEFTIQQITDIAEAFGMAGSDLLAQSTAVGGMNAEALATPRRTVATQSEFDPGRP